MNSMKFDIFFRIARNCEKEKCTFTCLCDIYDADFLVL
jgi:hypothetical protein